MRSQIVNILISFFLLFPVLGNAQTLISATESGVLPAVLITFFGITEADYNVRYYKVTYNTIDLNGDSTVASGMIAIPMNPTCDSLPLALFAHGTALLRTEVPSNDSIEADLGKSLASRGYVVAMPDYLGMGDNPGLHPYQHWKTEATVSIDILRAAKEFIQDSLSFDFSNEVFLTGYSQGGHAAMATAKYIQDNQLESEFNVAGLAPMSGAYHISKRQTDEIIQDIAFPYSGYIVYLVTSYERIYGGIYSDISDFLQSPYDTLLPPYYDGTYSMLDVQPLIPLKASDYITATFLSDFIADSATKTTAFWQSLLDNDNYDWTPTHPVKFMYCNGDDLVNPLNTQDAFAAMTANGASNIEKEDFGNFNHLNCYVPATSATIDYFQSLRTDCVDATGVKELQVSFDLNAYPNPVNQRLNIVLDNQENGLVEIISVEGKMVYTNNIFDSISIPTQNLATGMYFVKVTTSTKIMLKQISITH